MDILRTAEFPEHDLRHLRIRMHRHHQVDITVACDGPQSTTHVCLAFALCFPSMKRGEDQGGIPPELWKRGQRLARESVVATQTRQRYTQRVDGGVAGHVNSVRAHAFSAQILLRLSGRGEVKMRKAGYQNAMHFFGPGAVEIPGAQAGLDMGDRHTCEIGGLRGCKGGGGIAVDQNRRMMAAIDHTGECHRNAACQGTQARPARRKSEVDIGMTMSTRMNALLTTRLPPKTVRDTMFTGARIGGEQAVVLGMVDAAGEAGDLGTLAREVCARMLGKPRHLLAGLKHGVNKPLLDLFYSDIDDGPYQAFQRPA